MALGLDTGSSNGEATFNPLLIYNAKAGRLYKRDRIESATSDSGWENRDTELPTGTKFAVDFGRVEIGWMKIATGMAPSFHLVPLGQPMPPRPDQEHRQGFRLLCWGSPQGPLGGIRELAATAKTVLSAVDELHTEFEAAPEAAAGKIPVVSFVGADPVTTKNVHGTQTNFRPRFEVVQWIDRPEVLGERTVPPPARKAYQAAAAPAAPASPAPPPRHVGPPVRQAERALVDDEIPF